MRVLVIQASLLSSIVRFGYSPEFQSRMSPFGPSRRLLRKHKNGRYWSEADMTEIYQYAP
jgi:hypothetical protein